MVSKVIFLKETPEYTTLWGFLVPLGGAAFIVFLSTKVLEDLSMGKKL